MIKRALISVWDKRGLEKLVKTFMEFKIEILATGGTSRFLKEIEVPHNLIEDITGFPEILEGRVKTLHPKIFAGILSKRDNPEHLKQVENLKIKNIDVVVCNFYPFEEATKVENLSLDEALEMIDIGGPSLIRASAKNFIDVIPVVDPDDYQEIIERLHQNDYFPIEFRKRMAIKAFQRIYLYDIVIYNYLNSLLEKKEIFPEDLTLNLKKLLDLRYGENPHQRASLYIENDKSPFKLMKIFQGKELSFNNILDIEAAYKIYNQFNDPFCVIIKHNNPCGAAIGKSADDAFSKALSTDPMSAFGGIIGFNQVVDEKTASLITLNFFEVVVSPHFNQETLKIFSAKKNLRVVEIESGFNEYIDFKRISGGFLIQETDSGEIRKDSINVVTEKSPSDNEMEDMMFAWKICKFVKSNAIVVVRNLHVLGIGAGQMSRVDSVELAIKKSNFPLEGAVLASDGFFPFSDSIEIAAKSGIKAIIQPGGSIRDKEVIEAANRYNISMVFTGVRHFRH
ncbi:MAG: bifunctional phosphoribosylaminoimidazolecarboxamide formyltransferase/IMP cyclohydrolase [Acidobacteriota bacterium]